MASIYPDFNFFKAAMLTFRNGEFYYTGILTFDYFHLRSLNLPFGNIKGEDFFPIERGRSLGRSRQFDDDEYGLQRLIKNCFAVNKRRALVI